MQEIKYKGNYMSVTEELIDDHVYERTTLRRGVHVIPIRNNKVLFMNESRTHESGSRWKLVSGWCDKEDKTPLDHAKEELAEELGMQAETWGEYRNTDAPGATINPNTYYFICRDVSELINEIENPDNGCEVLGSRWMNFDEIFDALEKREMWMDDSALCALLALYKENKNKA